MLKYKNSLLIFTPASLIYLNFLLECSVQENFPETAGFVSFLLGFFFYTVLGFTPFSFDHSMFHKLASLNERHKVVYFFIFKLSVF